jgi:hypothetical protein
VTVARRTKPVAALALLATGCLSSPTGQPPADAVPVDAAVPVGLPWPPEDPVVIGSARVHDLDGDGIDDLTLATTGDGDALRGIWFLKGGPDFGTHYQGQVLTGIPSPEAFELADLGGDATRELIVFSGDPNRASILVYPALAPFEFDLPWQRDTNKFGVSFADENGYRHLLVRVDDFHSDGTPTLLFGTGGSLFFAPVPTFSQPAIEELTFTQVPGNASFGGINNAYVAPSQSGNQLVVDREAGASAFPTQAIEAGLAQETDRTTPHRYFADADLDGDGVLDQVGGEGGTFTVEQPYPLDDHAPFTWDQTFSPGHILGMAIDRLDNDARQRLDAAFLDDQSLWPDELSVLPQLRITHDVGLTFDSTAASILSYGLPDDLEPALLVTGEFDGAAPRELLVIGRTGRIVCLHVYINSFDRCDPEE